MNKLDQIERANAAKARIEARGDLREFAFKKGAAQEGGEAKLALMLRKTFEAQAHYDVKAKALARKLLDGGSSAVLSGTHEVFQSAADRDVAVSFILRQAEAGASWEQIEEDAREAMAIWSGWAHLRTPNPIFNVSEDCSVEALRNIIREIDQL